MTNNERDAARIRALRSRTDEAAVREIIRLRRQISSAYPMFIDKCCQEQPYKFKYINKFPTTEEIRSYYQYGHIATTDDIPLYEYGWFDIKELAAIIKQLYSLKRQREYRILTFGNLDIIQTESKTKELAALMNFLIGDDKALSEFGDFTNYFYNDCSKIDWNYWGLDRYSELPKGIKLVQEGRHRATGLGITFKNESFDSQSELINYYDPLSAKFIEDIGFADKYNIFNKNFEIVIRGLEEKVERNVGAIMTFPLGIPDNFIAKALMSIVIYKKKVGKPSLSNDDYREIFWELFHEDVDIGLTVDREIPKTLALKNYISLD